MGEVAERPRPPTPSGRSGPAAALRLIADRDFGPYFVGNALSATGTWFQNLAAAILVFRLTGSEFVLGLLTFAHFVPMLVLAPWAGAAADRFERRRIVLVSQAASALFAGGLAAAAWLDLATTAVVIAFSLAIGVASAFAAPAAGALIAGLVSADDLPSAVGLNSMTYNIARAVGPGLAGVTVATLGIPAAFTINAFSYLSLALAMLVVRPRPSERAEGSTRLRDSVRMVVEDRRLGALLVIVAIVGFASDPINTLAPAFAEAFGRPDTDAGFLIGVFGAGAVTAALLLAGRIAGSRSRLAAMLALLGLGMAGFSLIPSLAVALPVLFLAGFGYLAANTAATSRLQLEVDERHRGRIMALWTVAFLGLRPFASLLDGAIADVAGVRVAGVVLALPAIAAAVLLATVGREARSRPSPRPAP
jgi:MFS family permease